MRIDREIPAGTIPAGIFMGLDAADPVMVCSAPAACRVAVGAEWYFAGKICPSAAGPVFRPMERLRMGRLS